MPPDPSLGAAIAWTEASVDVDWALLTRWTCFYTLLAECMALRAAPRARQGQTWSRCHNRRMSLALAPDLVLERRTLTMPTS